MSDEQRVQTIRDVQDQAWRNKLDKEFNTTDVPMEFCLLMTEVGEAFDAWRKDPAGLGGELADVMIFLVSLAQMNGIDLAEAVERKLAVNRHRSYSAGPNGLQVRRGE